MQRRIDKRFEPRAVLDLEKLFARVFKFLLGGGDALARTHECGGVQLFLGHGRMRIVFDHLIGEIPDRLQMVLGLSRVRKLREIFGFQLGNFAG